MYYLENTYTIKDELNIDGGKHVLAMFLNKKLFWMNNKTISEFNSAFVSHEELWRSRSVLSVEAATPSSISIIRHKILGLIH